MYDYRKTGDKLDALRHLTEQGKTTLRVAGIFLKERAAKAHRLFEVGGVRDRLVIEFRVARTRAG